MLVSPYAKLEKLETIWNKSLDNGFVDIALIAGSIIKVPGKGGSLGEIIKGDLKASSEAAKIAQEVKGTIGNSVRGKASYCQSWSFCGDC